MEKSLVSKPPRRSGLIHRVKNRSNNRVSMPFARKRNLDLLSSTSSTSSMTSNINNKTSNINDKKPANINQKNSKLYQLASDYESILKKVWDPIPGIRLRVNGDVVIQELKKIENIEASSSGTNEEFWEKSSNKTTFPVLCNYITVWQKRRGGVNNGGKSGAVSRNTIKTQPCREESININTEESIEIDNSSKKENRDRMNDNYDNNEDAGGNHDKVDKKGRKQHQQKKEQEIIAAEDTEGNDDDAVIQSTKRVVNGQVVELDIFDADPNIGVRARLKGYNDSTMLVKEDDMLGILLNNGVSENDLGSMDLSDIIEKLLSFVNVKLVGPATIKLGFGTHSNDDNKSSNVDETNSHISNDRTKNSVSNESTLTFENIETGHAKSIEDILVFNDNKYIISCSMDKSAHLWTYSNSRSNSNFAIQSKKILFGHTDVVTCASTCGDWICTGSRDSTLRIWSIDANDMEAIVVNGHDDVVRGVEMFKYNNKIYIISASRDKTIKMWELNGNKCTLNCTWKAHTKPVVALSSFVAQHAKIVSASNDKTLRIWDVNNRDESIVLKGHEKAISCVQVEMMGPRNMGKTEWVILSGSSDKSIRIWSLQDGVCLQIIKPFIKPVIKISILKNSSINKIACLALTSDSNINLIDLTSYEIVTNDFVTKENKLLLGGASIRSLTSCEGGKSMHINSCFFGLRDGKIGVASVQIGNDVMDLSSDSDNAVDSNSSDDNYVTWGAAVEQMAKDNVDTSAVPTLTDGGKYINVTEQMLGSLVKAKIIMYNSKKKTWSDGIIWHENVNGSFDIYLTPSNDRKIDVAPSKLLISSKYVEEKRITSNWKTLNGNELQNIKNLKIDLKVLSRYRCGWEYYSAKIKSINETNNTVKLLYEDGDEETISPFYLKPYDDLYHENELVEVKYKGKKKWYRGIVHKVEEDGRYTIKYNLDGEIEVNVKRKHIWYVDLNDEKREKEIIYNVGDSILCRHHRGARYFSGKIKRIDSNGNEDKKYDVVYDDGDSEKGVERWLLKKKADGR
eukprot:g2407.t1